MLTIKAMVKKDGLRVDRKYNVKLCFTYNRKVKRLSTSLFASPEDLTRSLSFKEGTILKQKVDKLVETYKEMCDKLQVDAHHFTLDDIKGKPNSPKVQFWEGNGVWKKSKLTTLRTQTR